MESDQQPENQGGVLAPVRAFWSNPAYRFVALFLVYLGVAALLYPQVRYRYPSAIDALASLTARIEYWLLVPFSSDVAIGDRVVTFGGFAVKVIEECTGIYETLIFAAAVLAFPTDWRRKAIGIALGVPILYLFNVLRMLVLIIVGRYWPSAFDFMHLYFWQATLILMITGVWLLWIFKVVRHEKTPLPAGT